MKKITILALVLVLACSMAACGCQTNNGMDNGTNGTAGTNSTTGSTTDTIIDPTILDPTFETNIPDGTVNDNSTDNTGGITDNTGATENTNGRAR